MLDMLEDEMTKQEMREDFEAVCRSSDYLIPLSRMEGGEYCYISAEWKWKGWKAACASKQKEITALQAQLREQHQNQLDLMERIPVNPDEVYSPNTIVIDDKCRKCAGQMRDGKAITQTSTGIPDFAGGAVVTMSAGGSGKMVDVRQCKDCGWSATK